jgi:hypothetical protein
MRERERPQKEFSGATFGRRNELMRAAAGQGQTTGTTPPYERSIVNGGCDDFAGGLDAENGTGIGVARDWRGVCRTRSTRSFFLYSAVYRF